MQELFSAIITWIAPMAVVIATYFLGRFVVRREKFEDEVGKKLEEHSKKVSDAAKDMKSTAVEIQSQAVSIKEANSKFQTEISRELIRMVEKFAAVEVHVIKIESILDRTKEKADQLELKVSQSLEQATRVNEKLTFHDRAVSQLAKFAQDAKAKLDVQTADITTIKRQINENLIHISSQKKKNPSDKS